MTLLIAKIRGQHQRVIVCHIACAIEKGHTALLGEVAQMPNRLGIGLEFDPVAPAELGPTRGIMAEPFAQGRGWSDLFVPQRHRSGLFGHAARPNTIHENPQTVIPRRRFINPLDPQIAHHRCTTLKATTAAMNS